MFMVYWTQFGEHLTDCTPMSKPFDKDDMGSAMEFMKELRNNPDAHFITMASELPNNVGKMGVAGAPADYNWTKRRNNERDPNVVISKRKMYNANDEVEVSDEEVAVDDGPNKIVYTFPGGGRVYDSDDEQ